MRFQKVLIILTIMTVGIPAALTQSREFIIHHEVEDGDSLSNELIFRTELGIEFLRDSLDEHFVILQDGMELLHDGIKFIQDSSFNQILVHKLPFRETRVARIVIKKSGFFRKSKIVIDFDPFSKEIVKVVDNGEEIPEKKLYKYQEYLEDATEYSELEALHPRMEEIELEIDMLRLPDSEKLADLEALIIDLEGLKSDRAYLKKEHYTSIKRVIELESLEEDIQNALEEAGMDVPKKIETIEIKKGKFFLNDKEITGTAGEKCVQAYINNSDLEHEDLEKKGEEISIQIRFH